MRKYFCRAAAIGLSVMSRESPPKPRRLEHGGDAWQIDELSRSIRRNLRVRAAELRHFLIACLQRHRSPNEMRAARRKLDRFRRWQTFTFKIRDGIKSTRQSLTAEDWRGPCSASSCWTGPAFT
jgi:hypothetical protein